MAPADYGTLLPVDELNDKRLKFKFLRNVPADIVLNNDPAEIDEDMIKLLKKITVIFETEDGLMSFNIKSYLSFKGIPKGTNLQILDTFRIKKAEPSKFYPNQSYKKYDQLWDDFINDLKIVDKSVTNFYSLHPLLRDELANTDVKDGSESYKRITIETV